MEYGELMTRSGRLPAAICLISVCCITQICPAATTFQSVGLYQSFAEMTAWIADFAAANSDIVNVVEFGRSHQDRPLLAIQMSLTPGTNDESKPEFLFTGGVHAREVIGSEACYRLAEQLVGGYRAANGAVLDILAEREVWIVPNLNPDGRVFVEAGYSQQRKNMQWYSGQNTDPTKIQYGVDLNRNFPHRWEDASASVAPETYRGPSALSTPEANAFWFDLLKNPDYFSNLLASIDYHSGAANILTPWISPNDFAQHPLPAADRAKFDFLAERMNDLTGYSTSRLNYDSYATLTDSLYEEFGAYAVCEELYKGPNSYPTDFFALFNPVNQAGIDLVTGNAIRSAMFLLSDEAFALVPEPSVATLLLASLGIVVLIVRRS